MKSKYIAGALMILLLVSLFTPITAISKAKTDERARAPAPEPMVTYADRSWDNQTGSWDWTTADDWNGNGVPTAGEIVQFDATNTTSDCWINTTDATNDIAGIFMESDYTGTLHINAEEGINTPCWINMTGGTIDAPSPVNITVAYFNMSGGTIGNNVMINVTQGFKITGGTFNSRHIRIGNSTTCYAQTNQALENFTVLMGDVRLAQDTKLNGDLTLDSDTIVSTDFRVEEYKFECEDFVASNTGTTIDVHTRDNSDIWINKDLLLNNAGGSRVSFGTPDTNYNLSVNDTFNPESNTFTTFPKNDWNGWPVHIYRMVMQGDAVVNNSDSQSDFDYVNIEDTSYYNISDGQISPTYFLNLTGGVLGYQDTSWSTYWIQITGKGRFYCDSIWFASQYSYAPLYIGENAVIETSVDDVDIDPSETYDYGIFIENNTRSMTFDKVQINSPGGSSYRVQSGIKLSNCSSRKIFNNVTVWNSSYALYTDNTTNVIVNNMRNFNNSDSVLETNAGSTFTIKNSILSMLHNTSTNETVTRGAVAGTSDELPKDNATRIVKVGQGGTTYTETTDYVLDGDSIDWSPGGSEPAPGTTYYVVYIRRASVSTVLEDGGGSDVTLLNTTWDLYENGAWGEFSSQNYTVAWYINVNIIDEHHNDISTDFTIESSKSGTYTPTTDSNGWYRYFVANERKSVSGASANYNPWYINVTGLSSYQDATKTTSVGSGSKTIYFVLQDSESTSTSTNSTFSSITQLIAQFIPLIALILIIGAIFTIFNKSEWSNNGGKKYD